MLYFQWCCILKEYYLRDFGINIENVPPDEIPILFYEYNLRTFQKIKYNIYLSKELLNNPKYNNFEKVIKRIIAKAKRGCNINGYLSRRIKNINTPDKIFNDWGVTHLHLSNELESDGFVRRTKELLFVYRNIYNTNNNLYFLDICEHGDWYDNKLIEILENNWPHEIDNYKIKNFNEINFKIEKSDDIKNLRKAGINSFSSTRESYYAPLGGGETMNGKNTMSVYLACKMKKIFNEIEAYLTKKYNVASEQLKIIELYEKKVKIQVGHAIEIIYF